MPASFRERQWQVREEAILDAAHELMAERGYADTSMDDLAARVGVSKATLYQHVASKEDLAVRVITRLIERTEEELRALDPSLPAMTRLETWMRQALGRRTDLWAAGVSAERGSLFGDARFVALRERMTRLIAELVDQAKEDGDLRADLPTPVIVRTIQRLFSGPEGYGDLIRRGLCSQEDVSRVLVSMVFDGIRTREG